MNDDRVFALGLIRNHLGLRPHIDTAAACAIRLNNARSPINLRTRGEIRARNKLHQRLNTDLWVLQCCQTTRYHLP